MWVAAVHAVVQLLDCMLQREPHACPHPDSLILHQHLVEFAFVCSEGLCVFELSKRSPLLAALRAGWRRRTCRCWRSSGEGRRGRQARVALRPLLLLLHLATAAACRFCCCCCCRCRSRLPACRSSDAPSPLSCRLLLMPPAATATRVAPASQCCVRMVSRAVPCCAALCCAAVTCRLAILYCFLPKPETLHSPYQDPSALVHPCCFPQASAQSPTPAWRAAASCSWWTDSCAGWTSHFDTACRNRPPPFHCASSCKHSTQTSLIFVP